MRKQLRLRHYACDTEIAIITQPGSARWHVEKRDHGICIDCREDWSERYRFAKGVAVVIHTTDDNANRAAGFYRYSEVIWVSLWHVDHKIPLWKVRDLPPFKRIEYFKLANLVTRCGPCHKIKSRREAAERAKFNAMAADPVERDRQRTFVFRSRPMGSGRGFPPKGSRPFPKKR